MHRHTRWDFSSRFAARKVPFPANPSPAMHRHTHTLHTHSDDFRKLHQITPSLQVLTLNANKLEAVGTLCKYKEYVAKAGLIQHIPTHARAQQRKLHNIYVLFQTQPRARAATTTRCTQLTTALTLSHPHVIPRAQPVDRHVSALRRALPPGY